MRVKARTVDRSAQNEGSQLASNRESGQTTSTTNDRDQPELRSVRSDQADEVYTDVLREIRA